jgi:hypothetical protein
MAETLLRRLGAHFLEPGPQGHAPETFKGGPVGDGKQRHRTNRLANPSGLSPSVAEYLTAQKTAAILPANDPERRV